jgi:hypothetical protein
MYYATTEERQQQDAFVARQRQMQEQAAAGERASRSNVEIFTKLFLGLGADAMKLAGTRHDAELAEARGLAAARWNQLLSMEAQVIHDEQQLAARPKKRPAQPGDDLLADEVIKRQEQAFEDQTRARRDSLEQLKEQAKRERKELESLRR